MSRISIAVLFSLGFLLSACEESEPEAINQYPVINSVTVAGGGVMLGDTARIMCLASDEDQDELTYIWTIPTGEVLGSGSSVAWVPPEYAALYPVEIRVEDGKGGYAEWELEVQVHGFGNQTWRIYNTENSEIPNNYPLSVAVSISDKVWIGGEFSDLTLFTNNSWSTWDRNRSEIRDLAVDSHENVWVATDGGTVAMFNGTEFTEHPDATGRSISIDANDHVWVGGYNGLFVFDGSSWTNYNSTNSPIGPGWIMSVTTDLNGNTWFAYDDPFYMGIDRKIMKFDGNSFTTYSGLDPSGAPRSLAVDQFGNLWISSFEGIFQFDGVNSVHHSIPIVDDPLCFAIAIDHNGHVFVSVDRGVARWDGHNWLLLNHENSMIPEGWVSSIAVDSKNNKFICIHENGGLAVYNELGIH